MNLYLARFVESQSEHQRCCDPLKLALSPEVSGSRELTLREVIKSSRSGNCGGSLECLLVRRLAVHLQTNEQLLKGFGAHDRKIRKWEFFPRPFETHLTQDG
jgi:hypothetical protein